MTSNPEVIRSPVGLVPTNALVLTEPMNSHMVNSEPPQTGFGEIEGQR